MIFILGRIKKNKSLLRSIVLQATMLVFLLGLSVSDNTICAQEFPATPNRLVNDYTGTLSTNELNALEQKLRSFEDTSATQIAVVLIKSTGEYDVADYAVRLAQKWGVGQAKYNNGIVLLAAIGDRAVTIQTGYGVEGAVPDAIAYRIIEDDIKPAFREGLYYDGLNAATNSLIKYTKGEYKAEKKGTKGKGRGGMGIVVLVVIFIIISIISQNGGGKNKGRKIMDSKGTSDLLWWMLLNGMGGGNRSGRGGGGFDGGSFGGGGGGFGGFGGGGFGGGGASGRW